MMDDLFNVVMRNGVDATVVCQGELDICAVPDVSAALERALHASDGEVSVDMQGVRYIDSACVSTLLRAHDTLEARGSRLVVVAASPVVRRALQLLGVGDRLGLAGDPASVLAA
ncbi:MAG: STAS domain-containing protein [Armatimonadetes bacterium]|nr:STAS domain-containing protein [Armatimonadota bacterium]